MSSKGEHARAIVDDLDVVKPEAPSCLPWLATELAELFGKQATIYRPTLGDGGWTLEEAHASGPAFASCELDAALGEYLRDAPVSFAAYDPLRPERAQRNTALRDEELPTASSHLRRTVFDRLGARGWTQLRILACDGPLLLAWVGLVDPAPFAARERDMLQRLAAPIARRLTAERALGHGAFGAPFEAAVESNPLAVFVVSAGGAIRYANTVGAHLLGRDRGSTLETIRDAIRSPDRARAVDVRRLDGPGCAHGHLVTLRWQSTDAEARLVTAAARWRLTSRESAVLRLLARGDANKDIATKLGVSVATVEIHVTHVLKKARAESRTALVAAFYTT